MGYFGSGDKLTDHQKRWGAGKDGAYQWDKFDARFDAVHERAQPVWLGGGSGPDGTCT